MPNTPAGGREHEHFTTESNIVVRKSRSMTVDIDVLMRKSFSERSERIKKILQVNCPTFFWAAPRPLLATESFLVLAETLAEGVMIGHKTSSTILFFKKKLPHSSFFWACTNYSIQFFNLTLK